MAGYHDSSMSPLRRLIVFVPVLAVIVALGTARVVIPHLTGAHSSEGAPPAAPGAGQILPLPSASATAAPATGIPDPADTSDPSDPFDPLADPNSDAAGGADPSASPQPDTNSDGSDPAANDSL